MVQSFGHREIGLEPPLQLRGMGEIDTFLDQRVGLVGAQHAYFEGRRTGKTADGKEQCGGKGSLEQHGNEWTPSQRKN